LGEGGHFFYTFIQGMPTMVSLDQIGCMHMLGSDPFVVAFGESFPFDQILEHPTLTEVPVIDNFFDLLFFFSVD
jgi:hypothetical protein